MLREVLVFLLPYYVNMEMHASVQHAYISRKSHSDSIPSETGYVYSKTDDKPGSYMSYSSNNAKDYHYDKAKLANDKFLERMKSIMHYDMSKDVNQMRDYGSNTFNTDDDDVRTLSRNFYHSWPFYYSPYEHEFDKEVETIKDKRYVDLSRGMIKPVHEDIENDVPLKISGFLPTEASLSSEQSHPVSAERPFLSFVINDYTDKNSNKDEDSFTFKGLDDNYYDDNSPGLFMSKFPEYTYSKPNDHYANEYKGDYNENLNNFELRNSVTEKAYNKKHEFDKHEKGDHEKENHRNEYEQAGNGYKAFKDFMDSFINQHAAQNEQKDSKYKLKHNAHKGENKKGFHRVYHKDEYQEDKEFYDNNNKTAQAEESGGSNLLTGQSGAVLRSQAVAALGNEAAGYRNTGGAEKGKFENNHKGYDNVKGSDKDSNNYRNLAKISSQNNYGNYGNDYGR